VSYHFVALLVLTLVGQANPTTSDPKLVRVYVFTEAGETAEIAALRESVKDVSARLAGKKKTVVIVDDEDRADVLIEVVERSRTVPRVVFGVAVAARPGQPSVPPPQRVVHLRVKLTHREESVELKNKNSPLESAGGWKSAADDIAKQCERWMVEHHARLLASRGKSPTSRAPAPSTP
jgi:hypothetical protein